MMVMNHNGWDKRCPFCLSKKLQVVDYDVSAPQFHEKLGSFWFKMKCLKCGGFCEDINNLESVKELKEIAERKRQVRRDLEIEKVSDK